MNRAIMRSVVLLSAGLSLGGCQLFSSSPFANAGKAKDQESAAAAAHNDLALGEGRDHLRAGRYGEAIDSFNRSLSYGNDPAAAYNGLGVAYVKIGRPDLAYRFFRKASMSEPENPVYSRNLATLMQSPAFNLAVMKRAEPMVAPPQPRPEVAVAKAEAPAARPPGKLYKDSNRQFSITTRPDPTTETAAQRQACAAPARKASAPGQAKAKASACARPAMPKVASRQVKLPVTPLAAAAPGDAKTEAKLEAKAGPAKSGGKRKVIEMRPSPATAPATKREGAPVSARRATT